MKSQPLLFVLTILNFILLTFLLMQSSTAGTDDIAQVLRGRGLEIVDSRGQVRASITVYPPSTIDSRTYPETVVFRLADPKRGPVVKMDASENGSGVRFSDASEKGGVVLHAKKGEGASVQVTNPEGRTRTFAPE